MRHFGERCNDDARAGDLRAPTEIEVFTEHRDQRVESTKCLEEVGANERDTTGRDENVSLEVLLSVIDLTLDDALAY
jgi:hypothetical protein